MAFSDKELHEFENIIATTLKQNSVEIKLSSLEGLRSRLNLTDFGRNFEFILRARGSCGSYDV